MLISPDKAMRQSYPALPHSINTQEYCKSPLSIYNLVNNLIRCSNSRRTLLLIAILLENLNPSLHYHFLGLSLDKDPLNDEIISKVIEIISKDKSNDLLIKTVSLFNSCFLKTLSPDLLYIIMFRGFSLKGSIGVHCGFLCGWQWVPLGESLTIYISNQLSVQPLNLSRYVLKEMELLIFSHPLPSLETPYFVRVIDSKDNDLKGSPIYVSPANIIVSRKSKASKTCYIIVPFYDDYEYASKCLKALISSKKYNKTRYEIVAVWDHGHDNRLFDYLCHLASASQIVLITNPRNVGFIGSINYGLSLFSDNDVVILNSDAIVSNDWLDRLREIAYFSEDFGVVSPMGTSAEHLSFPKPFENFSSDLSTKYINLLDNAFKKQCKELNYQPFVEMPTGVGFCMYIKKEVLKYIGGFDGLWLFHGYGEEVDFCYRARQCGYKTVAALNTFVYHKGNSSYGLRKRMLVAQNNRALFIRYPRYEDEYDIFVSRDCFKHIRQSVSKAVIDSLKCPILIVNIRDRKQPYLVDYQKDISGNLLILQYEYCGDSISITIHIKSSLPIADLEFTLPNDAKDLFNFIEKVKPKEYHLFDINNQIINYLPQKVSSKKIPLFIHLWRLPDEWNCLFEKEKKFICSDVNHQLVSIFRLDEYITNRLREKGIKVHCTNKYKKIDYKQWYPNSTTNSIFLVPPPISLKSWKNLCQIAYKVAHQKNIFWVIDLYSYWRHCPCPSNIVEPSEEALRFPIIKGLLIVDQDPLYRIQWALWAKKLGIKEVFSPILNECF